MTAIGIMQGRLVPPVGDTIQAFPASNWAEEFPRAAAAGVDCIEWIYDAPDHESNPIAMDEGMRAVAALSETYAIPVRSVCADYFMARPLVRVSGPELVGRADRLAWLIGRASRWGMHRIVLPFVDASGIHTEAECDHVVDVMQSAAREAEHAGVELHLETALAPKPFARLIERIGRESVKVNYDSGNSASLGFDVHEEFAAYGSRVGSVHIKDRVRGGGTVPLGAGSADLPALVSELRRVGYSGDYILQVARGTAGDEVGWARTNRDYLLALLR